MAIQYVPQGNEFRVNTYTTDYQFYQSIATLADGGFVVTWLSAGGIYVAQDGSYSGVYGQVYDGDGSPVGGEFRINTYTPGSQSSQSITGLASSGFVVTWASYDQDGSGSGVYGQVYSGDGTTVGSEFRVNTYTTGSQTHPSVTSLAVGGFVVTWVSQGQDGSKSGIYGQIYGGNGSPVGGEFRVSTNTSSYKESPCITGLADGGFVVTWESYGQDGSEDGVYGQVYSYDGSRVGGEFRINTYTTGGQYHPSATNLADGGFVVTWMSFGQDGSEYGVYGQIYGGDGTRVGSEFRVNTYTTGSQEGPSVNSLADGGFVVTWVSLGQDGSKSGIYGQVYSDDGTRVDSEYLVSTYTTGSPGGPSVNSLADGGFVVAWSPISQDGLGRDVYGQVFAPHNNTLPSGPVEIVGTARQH
jgi:hypothetical protein